VLAVERRDGVLGIVLGHDLSSFGEFESFHTSK